MPKDLGRLVLAVVIGAAIAFPAGMMFGRRDDGDVGSGRSRGAGTSGARNVYSPNVTGDPYVLDQQRKLVEALEVQCRQLGERCAEAERARRWLDEALN